MKFETSTSEKVRGKIHHAAILLHRGAGAICGRLLDVTFFIQRRAYYFWARELTRCNMRHWAKLDAARVEKGSDHEQD